MKIFSRIAGPRGRDVWSALPGQALTLCLLFSLISISLEETFFFLAVVFWAIRLIIRKERLSLPRFFLPLVLYAALSLLSSAFSVNPAVSFRDARDLLLFLMVPLAYTAFRRMRDLDTADLAVFVSAAAAIVYSYFHFFTKALPGERIKGFMGHYMTQAGLLGLFCALALAMFIFGRKKLRFLWAAGFVAACPALILTMTRSAWIGLVVAVCIILGLYKPKLLVIAPVLAVLLFVASPAPVKRRAQSIFDLHAYSNRLRVEYLGAGLKIIRNFPLLGTGPDTVDMEFQNPKYGLSEEARRNVHLHSNIIQIAAERGLPALAAWLAFVVWAFLDLLKLLRERAPAVYPRAAAALAVLVSLFVAGLFEYNFGDSEIAILFLYLLTAPLAALKLKAGDAPPSP